MSYGIFTGRCVTGVQSDALQSRGSSWPTTLRNVTLAAPPQKRST